MAHTERAVRFAASLLMIALIAGLLAPPSVARAATNLLTTNPSFETATVTCIGNSSNNTSIAGWLTSLYSYNCAGVDSAALAGKDGTNYARLYGGGKLETAPAARAAVSAGTSYTLEARVNKSRANTSVVSPAFLRIVFYNGAGSGATEVGRVSSPDILPGAATTGFAVFSVTAVAPAGATHAAAMFEFSRGSWPNEDTASFETDGFSLTSADSGGSDAVSNGGFENGTNGWTSTGTSAATSTPRLVQSGAQALAVGTGQVEVSQALSLAPNSYYALSAWGRTTAGYEETAQVALQITDGSNQTVTYRMKFAIPDWTRQARTIRTPTTISSARIFVRKELGEGRFFVDDIALISGRRDPLAWPHSTDSIWNTSIGNGAQYVSIPWSGLFGTYTADESSVVQVSSRAPLREAYTRGSTSAPDFGPCNRNNGWGSVGSSQGTLQLPDGYRFNRWTRSPNSTPNDFGFYVQGDGRTVVQFQPAARCFVDGALFGYRATDVDLYGRGTGGGHFGAGLSGEGGHVHLGELIGPAPIRHALAIEYHSDYFISNSPPFRWPADRADYYTFHPSGSPSQDYYAYCSKAPCSTNSSAFASVKMGSLLALAPGASIASLGLKTEPGKKLFYALQNYGAYIVDTSYRAQYISTSLGVPDEFAEHYGYSFTATSSATGAAKDWYDDLATMFQNLQVIDNNSPTSVGGGGAPRVSDPVPAFVSAPAAQTPLSRSGWSASATLNSGDAAKVLDGNVATYWNSGQLQAAGHGVVLNLGSQKTFNRVVLDGTAQLANYPQNYGIFVSNNGSSWGSAVYQGSGFGGDETIATFPQQTAQYVKIELLGGHINPSATWTLGELNLYNIGGLPNASPAPTLAAPTLSPLTVGAQSVGLSWSAVSGATGYLIKYGTRDGEYTQSLDVGNSTSYTFSGLPLYQRYYFVVAAYDNSATGSSPDSNERNAAPGGALASLSAGRPASASVNSASAANATDGATNTEWGAGGSSGWWQVDLGSTQAISRIAFNTGSVSGYASLRYKIEVSAASDMSGATLVVDRLSATGVTGNPSFDLAASGRYVRITFVPNPADNYAVLAEFNVRGSNLSYTNLAAGRPASADSAFGDLPAIAATDERTTTRWAATDNSAGHWLQIDLGQARSFDTIKIVFDYGGASYKYQVAVANDSSMAGATLLADRSTSGSQQSPPETLNVSATGRYVRITFATGSAYPSVREFEIYGTP